MPTTDLDTEIEAERHHLTESRAALARMRERVQQLFDTGDAVAGDRFGAESLGTALSQRIGSLVDDPNAPLFFGRLRLGEPEADSFHIGRRHVTDDAGEPMVLDWRAPLSRTFYQASAASPQGVSVRRRFGFSGGTLTGFEDEHLDRGEELGTASRILTAEIERPRVGPMRDIVATIQPDQDVLVRSELDETVCVQDGDVVMVPRGYHPVGAPHGYDLYYLNVMAGPKRQWIFRNDPAHDWIAKKP